jgi:hypothetical protein
MKKYSIVGLLTLASFSAYGDFDTDTIATIIDTVTKVYRYVDEMPVYIKDTKGLLTQLQSKLDCLDTNKVGQGQCLSIGCYSKRACLASGLADVRELIKPATDALFGKIVKTPQGPIAFSPGILVSALDTLSKLPEFIPEKLKPASIRDKIDSLMTKIKAFGDKMTLFVYRLNDIYDFLSSLEYTLDPQAKTKNLTNPLPLPDMTVKGEETAGTPTQLKSAEQEKKTVMTVPT